MGQQSMYTGKGLKNQWQPSLKQGSDKHFLQWLKSHSRVLELTELCWQYSVILSQHSHQWHRNAGQLHFHMISTFEKVDLGRVGQRYMEVSGYSMEWVFSFHFVWVLGVGLVHQAYTASALPQATSLAQFLWVTDGFDSDD